MPNTVLGKVSVVPRGDYSASTTYYALDIVGYQGGSYMGLKESTGVTPSNDQVNWMQLSGPGLPGEQGPQGVPGAAAGFGEATATVDDTSGTPSVEVETSGPDTAKVFTFKFYGLKGTKGDTGNKGDTGDTGPVGPQGVSVVTAQINEQGHLIITLSEGEPIDAGDATGPIGPQGIQGEAGESVGSIQRTSGTGAPGTTDTYTMYSTDGSQIGTFTVYNGTNGTGAGDFMADGSVPMTGALDMGGQRVTNVGAPTAPTDAVRQSDLEALSDEIDHILDGTTPVSVPAATEAKAGIVKPGEGMSVTEDGTLNVDDQLPAGGQTGQVLTKTESGEAWQDAPDGLPDGGETGQVLTKTSTGAQWDDVPSDLPAGGTDGQILTKTADGVAWEDAPEGGVTSFNSRTGAIAPQAGDYTADMVGAIPTQTGTQGQVLGFTADNTVGAMDAPSGLPDGGTPGQMLYQGESGPEWGDKPVMVVHLTSATTADKSYSEINEAINSGYAVFVEGDLSYFDSSALAGSSNVILNPCFYNTAGYLMFMASSSSNATERYYCTIAESSVGCGIISIDASAISFTPASPLTSDNVQDAIEEVQANVDAYKPDRLTATLSASGWSGNAQTITVNGVITNTSAQDIDISCADKASADAWAAGGVWCSNPTQTNRLTFTCTTPPTANINLNIRLWEVG